MTTMAERVRQLVADEMRAYNVRPKPSHHRPATGARILWVSMCHLLNRGPTPDEMKRARPRFAVEAERFLQQEEAAARRREQSRQLS